MLEPVQENYFFHINGSSEHNVLHIEWTNLPQTLDTVQTSLLLCAQKVIDLDIQVLIVEPANLDPVFVQALVDYYHAELVARIESSQLRLVQVIDYPALYEVLQFLTSHELPPSNQGAIRIEVHKTLKKALMSQNLAH